MHDNKYIHQWMHGNEYINQWMHADEWRDPRYDNYINSHECLINPSAVFLTQYSHILRYFYYYILSLIHLSMCFVYIISYSYFFIFLFIYKLWNICVYKVVISACQSVCLSDHNSETHQRIGLTFLLGNSKYIILAWFRDY